MKGIECPERFEGERRAGAADDLTVEAHEAPPARRRGEQRVEFPEPRLPRGVARRWRGRSYDHIRRARGRTRPRGRCSRRCASNPRTRSEVGPHVVEQALEHPGSEKTLAPWRIRAGVVLAQSDRAPSYQLRKGGRQLYASGDGYSLRGAIRRFTGGGSERPSERGLGWDSSSVGAPGACGGGGWMRGRPGERGVGSSR